MIQALTAQNAHRFIYFNLGFFQILHFLDSENRFYPEQLYEAVEYLRVSFLKLKCLKKIN